MDLTADRDKVNRRSFLGYTIAAIGGFIAATVGSATAIFAASPILSQEGTPKVNLGPITGFQQGIPKLVQFPVARKDGWIVEKAQKAVWVVRGSGNNFTVFNGHCTHLGCAYSWNAKDKEFECPCHGGRYSISGKVLAGPPPRPLDRLENQVEGNKLVIEYEDFRLGIPQKVEA